MATIDAVNAILAGNNVWKEYIARTTGVIDLTFVDLNGADLRNRILKRCDFSGAQLQGANFDHTKIEFCKFTGANLSSASLVQCELRNVEALNMISKGIVIRDSTLVKINLTDSNMSAGTIVSTIFQSCTFTNMHRDGLVLSSCELDTCIFNGLSLSCFGLHDCNIRNCCFTDCIIEDIQIHNTIIEASTISRIKSSDGSLQSSRFIECYINKFCMGGPNILCQNLDFSRSTLAYTELGLIGLDTATMLNTALSFCTWPEQRGRLSLTGKYTPSSFLLAQPVQDLVGVHPLMRREIADAQYLIRKIESCGRLSRPAMRAWGLCTGFGQSLLRLSLSTVVLVTAATIALLFVRNQLFGSNPDLSLLAQAVKQSFDAFFALANIPETSEPAELIVVILTRICGFIVLGFWVSILSIKLSRLGSE